MSFHKFYVITYTGITVRPLGGGVGPSTSTQSSDGTLQKWEDKYKELTINEVRLGKAGSEKKRVHMISFANLNNVDGSSPIKDVILKDNEFLKDLRDLISAYGVIVAIVIPKECLPTLWDGLNRGDTNRNFECSAELGLDTPNIPLLFPRWPQHLITAGTLSIHVHGYGQEDSMKYTKISGLTESDAGAVAKGTEIETVLKKIGHGVDYHHLTVWHSHRFVGVVSLDQAYRHYYVNGGKVKLDDRVYSELDKLQAKVEKTATKDTILKTVLDHYNEFLKTLLVVVTDGGKVDGFATLKDILEP